MLAEWRSRVTAQMVEIQPETPSMLAMLAKYFVTWSLKNTHRVNRI